MLMDADAALAKLKNGNSRYVSAIEGGATLTTSVTLQDAMEGQQPFAVILGCSDSRVPLELVFHRGLGELFVIRVAGNIVAPSQIGSIEFACQQFGTQLVVVMGHTHCGAVSATVNALTENVDEISPNLASIVDRVSPAVLPVVNEYGDESKEELMQRAMRANVEHSVNSLVSRSRAIRNLIKNGQLKIIGAEYAIETGKVTFYE